MTDAQLTALAEEIRDEDQISANTKLRVYSVLKNMIDSKPNTGAGVALVLMGNFSANLHGGTALSPIFPASPTYPGTGTAGAVKKGNWWYVPLANGGAVDVDGNPVFPAGSMVIAMVDTPGNTPSNWLIK